MSGKYGLLKVLATVYQLLAMLAFLGGVAGGTWLALIPRTNYDFNAGRSVTIAPDLMQGAIVFIAGLVAALTFAGLAQALTLLVDMSGSVEETSGQVKYVANRLMRRETGSAAAVREINK